VFGAQAARRHLRAVERYHGDRGPPVPGLLVEVQASSSHDTPALLPRAAHTHTEEACGEEEEGEGGGMWR